MMMMRLLSLHRRLHGSHSMNPVLHVSKQQSQKNTTSHQAGAKHHGALLPASAARAALHEWHTACACMCVISLTLLRLFGSCGHS